MHIDSTYHKLCVLFATCLEVATASAHARADSTFNVNTLVDDVDQNVSDGLCRTSSGACSLRAAVMQANHLTVPGTVHIVLPAGHYVLTHPRTGPFLEADGDLNLSTPLSTDQIISIEGTSAASSVIDANGIDRAIAIDQFRIAIISNVTIRGGNTSANTGSNDGGGIELQGLLTIRDSNVLENDGNYGGGIYVGFSGRLGVLRSSFRSNHATSPGGAAFVYGEATFRETSMTGNVSFEGGAIFVYEAPSRLNLIDSTINGNTAIVDGGGIFTYLGQSFIVNSTISGNAANGNGGGIYNYTSTWIYNTSIINNDSSHDRSPPGGSGGGVYNRPAGRLVATNSMIEDNTTNDAPLPDDCYGVLEVYGWNLLSDYSGCSFTGNGSSARGTISPNTVGPLADNGGPTMTHALRSGSQAIDSTTLQGCVGPTLALLATDQRGAPRTAGPRCDVGAFEYGSVPDRIFKHGFEAL